MFAACVAVHHHADRGLVLRAARADRRRTRLAPREECTRAVPVSTTARPASAPRSNCAGWRFCWSSAWPRTAPAAPGPTPHDYNGRRPHRALRLLPPRPDHPTPDLANRRIMRRPQLSGRGRAW